MIQTKQLYWQCRRGLLELDLLFIPFLKHVYPTLKKIEQKQFEILLRYSDPELLTWCLGQSAPPEALQDIVTKVQAYAKTAHPN